MPCCRLLLGYSCRTALLAVVLAGLARPGAAHAAEEIPAPQPVTAAAGQFEPVEFRLNLPGDYARPFDPDEVAVDLAITGPDGARVVQPAFFGQPYERQRLTEGNRMRDWFHPNGPARWQARFAPTVPGMYQAKLVVRDRQGTRESAAASFSCTASTRHGYVRVSTRDPRFLELSTGQAFFPLGQNLAFIGSGQYMTLAKAEEAFAKLADNGANYLRVWTCCGDWALAIEAEKNAFARSWAGPAAFVPDPAEPNSGRRCVTFPKGKNTLDIEPSHLVGLRPETTYTLTARWHLQPGTAVRPEIRGVRSTNALSAGATAAWVPFSHTSHTGPGDRWLGSVRFHREGSGTAMLADLSLREAAGGPELLWEADLNRPARGYYNPLDAFMLDELVAAASRHGLYLQLCLLTRDLYMKDLKDPASEAYTRAIADAKKFLRYAVARWGYATSVAAWEYWNEQDPGLPTDRFYTELGNYLRDTDPNHHLRTTSTWGPSPKDCRHPQLDLADTHFYLRPTDRNRLADEVEAVLDRARWLREQAPVKPACLGEFGIADDKWGLREEMKRSPELADAHNALWASALSGLSATAWCWWWERLDERDVYPHYRPLSRFIADVPWTSGAVQPAQLHVSDDRLHAVGLRAGDRAWLWLCNRQATWPRLVLEKVTPSEIPGITVEVNGLPEGGYRVEWWDPQNGKSLRMERAMVEGGVLRLAPPPFVRDVAAKVAPGNP